MIRVLCLSTLFPNVARPGFGRFVARQAEALAARGDIDLTVINPIARAPWPLGVLLGNAAERAVPEREVWHGVTVHRPRFVHIPQFGAPWNPGLIRRGVMPLAHRLHAEQPFDLVDAQFFYPDGPAAARIARALGLPLSIKARGSDIHYWGTRGFARRRMLAAAEQAVGLLAVSEALKRDMIALGMPADRIAMHYTGLDHELYRIEVHAAETRDEFGFSRDSPLLASVGNLVPLKGHDLTIAAVARLPGVQLAIAGQGPELGALRALAARLGIGDRVKFLGDLGPEKVARLLQSADAMVLPSEREGLANVWIEALACGTPLVISDVGGAREIVRDASAGRLVERTPQAIAAGVNEVLSAAPSRAEVAAHAARFSWDANAAQLAEYYRRIVPTPSRASRS
ncbi:MAG TPA: glycosyltransferase [Novosphingobium sp.]|nr:glycosyltransferase [Novosphingobium sp.]